MYNEENSILPRFEHLTHKLLVGLGLEMNLVHDRTPELWGSVMPRRGEIGNKVNNDLISLQVYPVGYFEHFDPSIDFIKWALVEVSSDENIPDGMQLFSLEAGAYAVFSFVGSNMDKQKVTDFYQYIFGTWLPNSDYQLDDRPHFEVLGARYLNGSTGSEEEVWIPVRLK
jgi:AraC family transcriptional regulator